MSKIDYYSLLGVSSHATGVEIRRAYRQRIQECHPDRNPDLASSAEKSKQLNRARDVLLDPTQRRRYDALLARKMGTGAKSGASQASEKRSQAESPQGGASAHADYRSRDERPAPEVKPQAKKSGSRRSGFTGTNTSGTQSRPQARTKRAFQTAPRSQRRSAKKLQRVGLRILVVLSGCVAALIVTVTLVVLFSSVVLPLFHSPEVGSVEMVDDGETRSNVQADSDREPDLGPKGAEDLRSPVVTPSPALADSEPEPTEIPLRFARLVFPDEPKMGRVKVGTPIHTNRPSVWNEVPDLVKDLNVTRWPVHQGFTRFDVLTPGRVLMAVSSRWGGGGSGGDWKKELSTRRDLENEGWVEVATLNEATSDKNKPLVWYIFERQFQGGESLRIRTEKYLAPRIFVPPSN